MREFSLYVHVPFCAAKCPYCDFNTYALPDPPEQAYTDTLIAELRASAAASFAERRLHSIYFGGGTPSLFAPASIARVIAEAGALWERPAGIEITLEANPEAANEEKLAGFAEAGVNRLSFGSQSFSKGTLELLGRRHQADDIRRGVERAHRAGISNVSLDLIFGVPGQSVDDLASDIDAAIETGASHVSAYNLTIEKGTPFFNSVEKGILKMPREERVVEMMELLSERLPANGFLRYEISNYASPGLESRHNLAYWSGGDYLGAGAGAHSLLGASATSARRWSNLAQPAAYMQALRDGRAAEAWAEELSAEALMFEFFFVGLRRASGVSLAEFERRFGAQAEAQFPGAISELAEEGLAERSGETVALTQRGFMLFDSALALFLGRSA